MRPFCNFHLANIGPDPPLDHLGLDLGMQQIAKRILAIVDYWIKCKTMISNV